jgi:hypothetical protein
LFEQRIDLMKAGDETPAFFFSGFHAKRSAGAGQSPAFTPGDQRAITQAAKSG